MAIDLATVPRVTAMLGRIEELARRQGAAGPDRRMATLYMEVGQYVHWLLRQDPASHARIAEEGRRWLEDLDARLARGGGVDLVEIGAVRMMDLPAPMWEIDGPPTADVTNDTSRLMMRLERSDDVKPARAAELMELVPDAMVEPISVSVDAVAEILEIDPLTDADPTDATATGAGGPAWQRGVRDLVDSIGGPDRAELTPPQRAQLAGRLVNATTQMESRWDGFPDAVNAALCGYIASRCRQLQAHMPGDIELKMALGRLRRYHATRRMEPVTALDDAAKPADSWDAEAERYWQRLRKAS